MGIIKPFFRKRSDEYPSYRRRLFIVITSIFVIFIALISCITYVYTMNQVMSEFNNTRLQAEKTFVSSAILTEYGIESFDARYDFLLSERIHTFLEAYQENRNNPALIDLEGLKKKLSTSSAGEIELYIINKDGIIDYTTYQNDYKLNLSQYPDFFSSLDRIRKGNEFRTDPWIRDFYDSGVYWKYGYLPTDDHEYVLELGLRNANYSRMHNALVSQMKKVTVQALEIPDLVSLAVYDKALREQKFWSEDNQKNLSEMTGLFSGDELKKVLSQVFQSKQSSVIDNPAKNQVISIQYINLSTSRSVSGEELSYIGILVFSTESMIRAVQLYRTGFVIATFLSVVLGMIIAQYLSAYISRPIEMMTEDVSIIARSSLTHSVRATGLNETERLRSSINHMVASINVYISEIEQDERVLKNELILREKAEVSLEKANKRLVQLSQITRHDILNQMTALRLYLEEISVLNEKATIDEYAGKTQEILEKIHLLLLFTYDYEKIGQEGPVWHNIHDILDEMKNDFAGQISVSYTGDPVEILADPLIKKVFYNLIDNTVRHGKKADLVLISFEEKKGHGCLRYMDNGIGIAQADKTRIFDRGFGKGSGLGMAFIKEVLESDDIMIRETGIPGQGVRFEMIIPEGQYRILPDGGHET